MLYQPCQTLCPQCPQHLFVCPNSLSGHLWLKSCEWYWPPDRQTSTITQLVLLTVAKHQAPAQTLHREGTLVVRINSTKENPASRDMRWRCVSCKESCSEWQVLTLYWLWELPQHFWLGGLHFPHSPWRRNTKLLDDTWSQRFHTIFKPFVHSASSTAWWLLFRSCSFHI